MKMNSDLVTVQYIVAQLTIQNLHFKCFMSTHNHCIPLIWSVIS